MKVQRQVSYIIWKRKLPLHNCSWTGSYISDCVVEFESQNGGVVVVYLLPSHQHCDALVEDEHL